MERCSFVTWQYIFKEETNVMDSWIRTKTIDNLFQQKVMYCTLYDARHVPKKYNYSKRTMTVLVRVFTTSFHVERTGLDTTWNRNQDIIRRAFDRNIFRNIFPNCCIKTQPKYNKKDLLRNTSTYSSHCQKSSIFDRTVLRERNIIYNRLPS